MVELNEDPEVVRYVGDTAFKDPNEAVEVIERLRNQYRERRMGRFLTCDRKTGEKLGWCGLRWYDREGMPDLGYRFMKKHWGKGYATESSVACLHYGFETLGLPTIFARAMKANTASVHVLRKLGFRENDAIHLEAEGEVGFVLHARDFGSSSRCI